jgi:hypothetical protein
MLDPITALATATAVFNGLKKAVEIGREAEDIFGQLSKWATAVADVHEGIAQADKPPPLFKKLKFANDNAAAFDAYAAKVKLQQQEKELYEMFLYGELQHLGMDGYKELIKMRRKIKEDRERQIYAQARARKEFVNAVATIAVTLLSILTACVAIWFTVHVIQNKGI